MGAVKLYSEKYLNEQIKNTNGRETAFRILIRILVSSEYSRSEEYLNADDMFFECKCHTWKVFKWFSRAFGHFCFRPFGFLIDNPKQLARPAVLNLSLLVNRYLEFATSSFSSVPIWAVAEYSKFHFYRIKEKNMIVHGMYCYCNYEL